MREEFVRKCVKSFFENHEIELDEVGDPAGSLLSGGDGWADSWFGREDENGYWDYWTVHKPTPNVVVMCCSKVERFADGVRVESGALEKLYFDAGTDFFEIAGEPDVDFDFDLPEFPAYPHDLPEVPEDVKAFVLEKLAEVERELLERDFSFDSASGSCFEWHWVGNLLRVVVEFYEGDVWFGRNVVFLTEAELFQN